MKILILIVSGCACQKGYVSTCLVSGLLVILYERVYLVSATVWDTLPLITNPTLFDYTLDGVKIGDCEVIYCMSRLRLTSPTAIAASPSGGAPLHVCPGECKYSLWSSIIQEAGGETMTLAIETLSLSATRCAPVYNISSNAFCHATGSTIWGFQEVTSTD